MNRVVFLFLSILLIGFPLTIDNFENENLNYLEIAKNSKFIIIENIPQFNEINSNQQLRFITLLDIIYDKNRS